MLNKKMGIQHYCFISYFMSSFVSSTTELLCLPCTSLTTKCVLVPGPKKLGLNLK
jgi:hypothetical protein